MLGSESQSTDADLDRPVLGDFLIDNVHLPLVQLGHQPVIDVLLRHAADEFLADLAALLQNQTSDLIIKEVAPGSLRAQVLYWMDRYISGDKNVQFLTPYELEHLVRSSLPVREVRKTDLLDTNPPNYALVFSMS